MPDFKVVRVTETPYLYVTRSCSMAPQDISKNMGSAFEEVWAFMQGKGIQPAGGALSAYYDYDPDKMTFRAGFVVSSEDLAKAGDVVKGTTTPAGEVLHFRHQGSYDTLRNDYELMMKHIADIGREMVAPTWEVYLNSPDQVPEAELVTDVYTALK